MLLDCWPYPGSGDFKEKWTMRAFVQGFWQSHDLYRQSQGQKVLASSMPHSFRGGTAEWEGCSDLGIVQPKTDFGPGLNSITKVGTSQSHDVNGLQYLGVSWEFKWRQ